MFDPTPNETFGIEPTDGWEAPEKTEGLEEGLFVSTSYSEAFGEPVREECIAIYDDTRLVVEHCNDGAYNFEYPDGYVELQKVVTELMEE